MNGIVPYTPAPIGFGPGGPLPAPTPWTLFGTYITFKTGGVVVGTPSGGSFGPGTLNATNLLINGVSINPNNFLQLTGGTINGPFTINTGPVTFGPGVVINGAVLDMGTY